MQPEQKTTAIQFPRFTFPSVTPYLSLFLLLCFILSLSTPLNNNELSVALNFTREFPWSVETHQNLATFYLNHHIDQKAETEFLIAQELLSLRKPDPRVLGQMTRLELGRKEQEEERIHAQKLKNHWLLVVEKYPYFRDGWVQLAYTGWFSKDTALKSRAVQKIRELDPIFATELPEELRR